MIAKEFNRIRADLYVSFLNNCPDVAEELKHSNEVTVWECWWKDKHEFLITTRDSQMNPFTLQEHGFPEPRYVSVKKVCSLNRMTKTATLCNGSSFQFSELPAEPDNALYRAFYDL